MAALALAAVTAAGAAASGAAGTAAKSDAPRVRLMVLLGSGERIERKVPTARTTAEVGRRRCAVGARTPLAALIAAEPGKRRLRDYGSCSSRPADASGLFVRSIRGRVNRGLDGWVYKVGRKLGTAGAADPAGPFGRGRLRGGDRVAWFYCVFEEGSCQRSLEVRLARSDRTLSVTGYDDAGEGVPMAGARVSARRVGGGRQTAMTDGEGKVRGLTPRRGDYLVRATKRGAIPSFETRVTVR